MTRRLITRLCAGLLTATLASGCVTQPLEESAVGVDPELGATAAPLDTAEAERVAHDARQLSRRHTRGAKHREGGVWIAPRKDRAGDKSGGLVRVDVPSEHAKPPTRSSRRDDNEGDERPAAAAGGDDDHRAEQPADDRDREETRERNDDRTAGRNDDQPARRDRPSPRPQPPAFRAIAGASDPNDDATGKSPRYADIRQLLIESDGTNARVTIAVAGDVPAALVDGEVQGIGVDFFRSDDAESDYQLFVDGGDQGWRAFLQTPDGVVDYPGSFAVGGRVFVFEVPWSTLGGRKPAHVNMFIDWSKRKTPLNDAGNDRAPAEGKVAVDPR